MRTRSRLAVARHARRRPDRFDVRCMRCGETLDDPAAPCPACLRTGVSAPGVTVYDLTAVKQADDPWAALFAGALLPVALEPLPRNPLRRLPRALPDVGLLLKDERGGLTWSYKDRLARVAVAAAKSVGARVIAVSSSGNHGAAVAAAATAGGLEAVVLTTTTIAPAMRRLVRGCGGRIAAFARPEDRWTVMRAGIGRHGWFPASNFHDPPIGSFPAAVDGYKVIAYEIVRQLGGAPDWVVVPVGYGDGVSGIARGFHELVACGLAPAVPRMLAAVTSTSLPAALEAGVDQPASARVLAPSALSIACPQSTYQALRALRDSNGIAVAVTDEQVLRARRDLGRLEGSFQELSSAAAFAAAREAVARGQIAAGSTVVQIATSAGLKDQELPDDEDPALVPLAADVRDVVAALGLDASGDSHDGRIATSGARDGQ